ncbi:MAG: discoidin domain-containing protein [Candidatus Rokubacteria bacterium]|nr:discoidin domain-containing protein [Candidatus Rokubacteria bacterium]
MDPRYALALASVLPIAQARLFLGLRWLGPGARWGLALALVALHGALDARLALGITGQAQAARAADTRAEAAHRLLGAHGVEAVYTPRWPSLYAFRWGPALAVAHPYQEIDPPLALRVDAAERVALLLPADDPQWTWLPASLRAAGLSFDEARTEGWRILWDFQAGPPVAPWRSADWRATATVNPEDAPAAIDGDLSTRWATGRGRHKGDALTVSLGRVETVAGVRWLPGSHREVPSGIRAEGSLDGERWTRLQEVRPYLGPVFASDGHPFVRLRRGRVELRFPPAAIRHLRLTHLGGAALPWSIRELVLLVPAAPPPARDPDALVRALGQAGVRRVYADHWLAAAISTATRGAIAVPISNETVDAYGRLGPRSDMIAPLRLGERDALVVGAEAGEETREALEASGVAVAVEAAGGFAVIRARGEPRPLGQRVGLTGWRVTATHRPAEADRTIDGRPETHWRSGTPQRPGMAVEFDPGHLLRLTGLRLVAARPDETPRALAIRLSPDGTRWARVEPEWRGALGWTGWSLTRLSQGVYAVAFRPQAARRVRLELTGAATGSEWSIAEAEWYVTGTGE